LGATSSKRSTLNKRHKPIQTVPDIYRVVTIKFRKLS